MFHRALVFEQLGRPENVLAVKRLRVKMNDDTVGLKIMAAPVNPSDINIIEGTYPLQPHWKEYGAVGGQEGVAEVIECGSNVRDVKVGDWVVPIQQSFNTWQTHAIADPSMVLKLPDTSGISPIIAGTISVNPPTAYRMLKDFVSLEQGDVVIQNSSNSGVGQSVIQLCKAWGFKSVNIIRSRENQPQLMDELYALGADLVLTEDQVRKPETLKEIERLGHPRLGLNGVGGKSATNLARLLSYDLLTSENGTMVTYGGMSREPVTIPTSLFIFRNITLKGFWLNKWFLQRPIDARIDIYKDLFDLVRQGKFKEPLHEKWSWSLSDEILQTIANRPLENTKIPKRILVE